MVEIIQMQDYLFTNVKWTVAKLALLKSGKSLSKEMYLFIYY